MHIYNYGHAVITNTHIYLIHKRMFWCLGGEGVMSKRNWLFPMEIRSRGNSLKWRRIVKYFRKALTPPLPHRAYCAFEITGWWISCHGWSSQSTRGICHIVMWHLCKIFLGLGKIFKNQSKELPFLWTCQIQVQFAQNKWSDFLF